MRVLLASSHGADPAYGGAERYVRDLALGLEARGHDVAVLSAFPQGEDAAGIETIVLHDSDWRESNLRRLRNHAGDVISAPWPRFRKLLDATGPELVHTSNLPGIGSGLWEVARRRRIPVVHTLHDYHLLCARTSLTRRDGSPCEPHAALCGLRTRRLTRWAAGVEQVVAGSNHLLDRHRGLFPASRQRVIRLPLAPPDGSRPRPPGPALASVGYLGVLTAPKGVELLLDAAAELARTGVELRIAGDGPLREQVEAAGVTYAGRVDGRAKAEFLASCDVGVVPSLWEEPSGPPYVVNEWLAAGRPVLVTRRGGLAEAAGADGVHAFDPAPAGLLEALRDLGAEPRWSQASAEVPAAESDADVRRWLDEHELVYEAAVTAGAAG